jgi:hypothetical protein
VFSYKDVIAHSPTGESVSSESVAERSRSWTRNSYVVGSHPGDILPIHPNLYSISSPLALSNNVPRTDLKSMWTGQTIGKRGCHPLKKLFF